MASEAGTGALLQAVGAFTTAFGQIKQAQATSRNLFEQGATADLNALIEEENAAVQVSLSRQRTRRIRGAQRVSAARSGLKFEGSPLLVELETARIGEFEASQIQRGFDIRASSLRQRGRALRRSAVNEIKAGNIRALTTLVTAGGNIASSAKGMI